MQKRIDKPLENIGILNEKSNPNKKSACATAFFARLGDSLASARYACCIKIEHRLPGRDKRRPLY